MLRIPIPKMILRFIAQRKKEVARISKLYEKPEKTPGFQLTEEARGNAIPLSQFDIQDLRELRQRQPRGSWFQRGPDGRWGGKR
jgi:hypothetical protein